MIYAKEMEGKAGKSVFVLGPKWRIHEYLHLNTIDTKFLDFVKPGEQIATLGAQIIHSARERIDFASI